MKNDANRWIAAISLLSLFAIIACAGTRSSAVRQAPQNVLVTNSSSQQVPVLPPARPAPGGAYIVAVTNAPSVKVVSSATSPVFTKDGNNPDVNGATYYNSFNIPGGNPAGISAAVILSASTPSVIDSISVGGVSAVAGEAVDWGEIAVYTPSNSFVGGYSFIIPTEPSNGTVSSYLSTVHIPVPAGYKVFAEGQRGAVTSNCIVSFAIAYHTVPNP